MEGCGQKGENRTALRQRQTQGVHRSAAISASPQDPSALRAQILARGGPCCELANRLPCAVWTTPRVASAPGPGAASWRTESPGTVMSGPGHCPASPSYPPAAGTRSRGSSVSSTRAAYSLSPSRPSPASPPRRPPVAPLTPTSPSRRRSKRPVSPLFASVLFQVFALPHVFSSCTLLSAARPLAALTLEMDGRDGRRTM